MQKNHSIIRAANKHSFMHSKCGQLFANIAVFGPGLKILKILCCVFFALRSACLSQLHNFGVLMVQSALVD